MNRATLNAENTCRDAVSHWSDDETRAILWRGHVSAMPAYVKGAMGAALFSFLADDAPLSVAVALPDGAR